MRLYHLTSYINARAILRHGLMPKGTYSHISMTRGIECVWFTSVMSMALSEKDIAWVKRLRRNGTLPAGKARLYREEGNMEAKAGNVWLEADFPSNSKRLHLWSRWNLDYDVFDESGKKILPVPTQHTTPTCRQNYYVDFGKISRERIKLIGPDDRSKDWFIQGEPRREGRRLVIPLLGLLRVRNGRLTVTRK
jgi:hypothetical protein